MAVRAQTMTRPTGDIRPFTIEIPDADLEALRRRIAATRWPDQETVDDQSQGVPLATSQALARYWEQEYDWRKVEARLNSLTRDDLLDNITLYWLTNTGVSSARLYAESKLSFFAAKGVKIPAAVSVFPDELYQAPKELGGAGVSPARPLPPA
ncbi:MULTISPECIES: epoxide hydrolase N-terminal domain-containing protein [Micromonospora]|uniref:epoxide hydrolase N-terminal domain-containing protein n=1 Tax=Micromonospora TaxID=1873 RepID=UPI001F209D5C|nr:MULTISPECIES: epoxide hydrolase N-terminal domain-containing protein [Micromonospora]